MTNRILCSTAAIALIVFSAPAFAQASSNNSMAGMNMSGTSNQSAPATGADKPEQVSPSDNDAKKPMSMKGMDMKSMSASNGKHGCMTRMHRTRTSMSMRSGNHHCMMNRKGAM